MLEGLVSIGFLGSQEELLQVFLLKEGFDDQVLITEGKTKAVGVTTVDTHEARNPFHHCQVWSLSKAALMAGPM